MTKTGITARRWALASLPAAALLGLLAVSPAMADTPPDTREAKLMETFSQMDADRDGAASVEEFLRARPNMKEAAFKAMDANGDGKLSPDEWMEFMGGHGKPTMGTGRMGAMGGGSGDGCPALEPAPAAESGGCPAFEGGSGASAGMPMVMPPAVSHETAK